jgi:hypothetical protein
MRRDCSHDDKLLNISERIRGGRYRPADFLLHFCDSLGHRFLVGLKTHYWLYCARLSHTFWTERWSTQYIVIAEPEYKFEQHVVC